MKGSEKPLVCVFAHPDDESFGPSGTIAKYSAYRDVYVICATDGNTKGSVLKNLSEIRKKELLKSAKILGVKKVFFLKYKDGDLCNNIYHEVGGKIRTIIEKIKPDTIMTFELKGVSGHIDHVFCSMVTTYLFQKLAFVKTLLYFVVPKYVSKKFKDYFIYFPQGYRKNQVDQVIDISKFQDLKIKAIKSHVSQAGDVKIVLELIKKLPKEEYFFVKKKS